MIVGIPSETFEGERRVAMVPAAIATLTKAGCEVLIEPGAGAAAGYPDAAYAERGAAAAADRADLFKRADIVCQVRTVGANPQAGAADLPLLRPGQAVIGLAEPLTAGEPIRQLAAAGVVAFSLELMPRITRAQSMDVLSSQATVAGYKAVLLAADQLPKMFPMLMTAAGTISPARVFVVGAGVAGLMAIATAKRLGAVVEAYDIRPAVAEQVASLGGKFVELELKTEGAEAAGGYAAAQSEDFLARQRELMAQVVARSDVVITTAAVPGRKAPILVTADMVRGMAPGSLVVDLAAERGGNCELTRPGETFVEGGVTVAGPMNLPATVPFHASQMFARNVATFLAHLVKEGKLQLNTEDEITRETLVTRDGQVVHARVREAMGLAAVAAPAPAAAGEGSQSS